MRCLACLRIVTNHAARCENSREFYAADAHDTVPVQYNFNGSNSDGSFTTTISNSFLSP